MLYGSKQILVHFLQGNIYYLLCKGLQDILLIYLSLKSVHGKHYSNSCRLIFIYKQSLSVNARLIA